MYQKRWQKNVLSNPGRALNLVAKIATTAASKNSKQALSTYQNWQRSTTPERVSILLTLSNLFNIYGTKTDRLYPSAPPKNKKKWFRTKTRKELDDGNSFNNYISNIREMITYFKDKNNKSKKKHKKYWTITTIIKLFDTFVIIVTTSISITLSPTWICLIAISIPTATACCLLIGNKLWKELILNKNIKIKKLDGRDQQTTKSFENLYRKSLQDNVISKKEYESLCIIFTKYSDETKNVSFL